MTLWSTPSSWNALLQNIESSIAFLTSFKISFPGSSSLALPENTGFSSVCLPNALLYSSPNPLSPWFH